MQVQHILLLLFSVALAGAAWPGTPARLTAEVAPAVAPVTPLVEGSRLMGLPALEFRFGIQASCRQDHAPKSLSISVADTRKTLPGAEIVDAALVNVTLSLPPQQIPPVAVDGFCSAEAIGGSREQLLVQDVFTAHLSLRCSGPGGDSITYSALPLDVTLVCDLETEAQGSAPESTDR